MVDNSPSDPRTLKVAEFHRVRCVAEPRIGLSYARNRGAHEATGDIVVYIDDDALPQPGWLQGLSAEFGDSRVFGVVGRILPLETNSEGARMCLAMGLLDGGPERIVIDQDTPHWFDQMRRGITGGANMAIRQAAFSVWQGFDPRLGLGTILKAGEEDYAFLSLIKRGYRVVYTPNAIVRHPFPETIEALRKKHLDTLAASVGFLSFLFAREPGLRAAILSHLLRHLPRGHRRSYRRAPAEARRLASSWREALAGMVGLMLFAQSARKANKNGASENKHLATVPNTQAIKPLLEASERPELLRPTLRNSPAIDS